MHLFWRDSNMTLVQGPGPTDIGNDDEGGFSLKDLLSLIPGAEILFPILGLFGAGKAGIDGYRQSQADSAEARRLTEHAMALTQQEADRARNEYAGGQQLRDEYRRGALNYYDPTNPFSTNPNIEYNPQPVQPLPAYQRTDPRTEFLKWFTNGTDEEFRQRQDRATEANDWNPDTPGSDHEEVYGPGTNEHGEFTGEGSDIPPGYTAQSWAEYLRRKKEQELRAKQGVGGGGPGGDEQDAREKRNPFDPFNEETQN